MSGSNSNRKQTEKLLASDPHCWYCGIEVIKTAEVIPAQATLEHLMSKRHPDRGRGNGIAGTVMACYDCNFSRGCWTGALIEAEQAAAGYRHRGTSKIADLLPPEVAERLRQQAA